MTLIRRPSGRGALGGVATAFLVAVVAACGDSGTNVQWETVEGVEYAASLDIDLATFTTTADTPPVWYKDLVVGTGDTALVGDSVFTHVTGWLRDGTQFQPLADFNFVFWTGSAIGGVHLGMRGQKVGGTRKLIIPPDWAYGTSSVQTPTGTIYAGAVVIFDVQLDSVRTPASP
jgi:FKBP-type peptidyl-prolyl cis-trans isomerase